MKLVDKDFRGENMYPMIIKDYTKIVEKGEKQRKLIEKCGDKSKELEEFGFPPMFNMEEKRVNLSYNEKLILGAINSRKNGDTIKCPECGSLNGLLSERKESFKVKNRFLNMGVKECYMCGFDMYYWSGYTFGTRKPRISTKEMLQKRDDYLKIVENRKKVKNVGDYNKRMRLRMEYERRRDLKSRLGGS